MYKQKALMITAAVSLAGVLFSGYMTFTELTSGTCAVGGCSVLLGLPTCVYGLAMYLIILAVSAKGFLSRI